MEMNNTAKIALNKILSVKADEVNKTLLESLFAGYHDKATNEFKESMFSPQMNIILTPDIYPHVKEETQTNLGILCFNRYVLESTGVIDVIGYYNESLDEDHLLGDLFGKLLNNAFISDKIDADQYALTIDHRDTMGFWCSTFLSSSVTATLLQPKADVEQRKKELFEQYKEQLNSDNPTRQILAANKIEKELMDMTRNHLKSDSGYDLYNSGSANLNNNYKTINVMRGAVFNDQTHKYDVVQASLMNGITKYDIPAFSNSNVAAAYPSAIGTAEAGYMSKIILALMQSVVIDPNPQSDCGTESTIPFHVTKKYSKYILDRNIKKDGKRMMITVDNVKDLFETDIEMYSPQCCRNNKICAKCAGNVFINMGVSNAGLLTTQFTMKLLNLKLKSKHDLSQSADLIPLDRLFLDENKYAYIENGFLKNKTTMRMYIPKTLDEIKGFYKEATEINCFGVFPVEYLDNTGKVIFKTILTFPAMVSFHIYIDVQETPDDYIVTYEPDSEICSIAIQQTFMNVEFFINYIYLYSHTAQIPYKLLTKLLFTAMEINKTDLTASTIVYEMLARRLCMYNGQTFAKAYADNPNIDQLSYDKLKFQEAVQQSGILSSMLFQDMSKSINTALAMELNGKKSTPTPFEMIIKA